MWRLLTVLERILTSKHKTLMEQRSSERNLDAYWFWSSGAAWWRWCWVNTTLKSQKALSRFWTSRRSSSTSSTTGHSTTTSCSSRWVQLRRAPHVLLHQDESECLCGSWARRRSSTPTSSRLFCRTTPLRRCPLIRARWAAGAWRRSTVPTCHLSCEPWTCRSSPTAGVITTGGWSPPTCCVLDHVWVGKTPVRCGCFLWL